MASMKLRPLRNWVVVKPGVDQDPTHFPLITCEGTIVAVGPGRMFLKVGDTVVYSRSAGVNYQFEGDNLLIMREEDIYLVKE